MNIEKEEEEEEEDNIKNQWTMTDDIYVSKWQFLCYLKLVKCIHVENFFFYLIRNIFKQWIVISKYKQRTI